MIGYLCCIFRVFHLWNRRNHHNQFHKTSSLSIWWWRLTFLTSHYTAHVSESRRANLRYFWYLTDPVWRPHETMIWRLTLVHGPIRFCISNVMDGLIQQICTSAPARQSLQRLVLLAVLWICLREANCSDSSQNIWLSIHIYAYLYWVVLIPNAVATFCFTIHDSNLAPSKKYTKPMEVATQVNVVKCCCPALCGNFNAGMTIHSFTK